MGEGIKVDPNKVEAIKSWEVPISVKGVRSFLGFANFYREFVPNFSEIVRPFLDLTKKDHAFLWTHSHDQAFEHLKRVFTTAPVLALYDPEKKLLQKQTALDMSWEPVYLNLIMIDPLDLLC